MDIAGPVLDVCFKNEKNQKGAKWIHPLRFFGCLEENYLWKQALF